jgi:hypothetical protein
MAGKPPGSLKQKSRAGRKPCASKEDNIMKFGLFVIPASSSVFRCIDGVWTALPSSWPGRYTTPEGAWKALSTLPGQPVRGDLIVRNRHLETLIVNRSAAKVIYGVPDDAELYTVGEVKKG